MAVRVLINGEYYIIYEGDILEIVDGILYINDEFII